MFRQKVISSNSNVYIDSPWYDDEVRLDFLDAVSRAILDRPSSFCVECIFADWLGRRKKVTQIFYASSFIIVVGAFANACRSEIIEEFNKPWGWFLRALGTDRENFFRFQKKACGLWLYLIEKFYPVF